MATHNIEYREAQAARHEITEAGRKLAMAKRERSPYAPEKQNLLIEKLNDYIEVQKEKGKPLTIAGFILASGIPKPSWYDLKNGKYDAAIEEYKLVHNIPLDATEYTNEDGEVISLLPWSEVIGRCDLLTQQQREEACVAGKAGNVIGNIFLLKAQHGLSDQPEQVAHQTNVQIVANAETAIKALEMLK